MVNVTVCAALVVPKTWVAKFKVVGERIGFGPEVIPVPLSPTDCELPTAASAMPSDALSGPACVGVNVTLIVQLAPAARLEPQVFVCGKSAAFVPVTDMPRLAG